MAHHDFGQSFDSASIALDVRERHPDYRAVLIAATNLDPGAPSPASEALLAQAERHAAELLAAGDVQDIPEIAAWRAAYLSFGVKPRVARSSVESLVRRAGSGLPRIDRLTDTYNAISILHLMPIGGEDLTGYVGPPRLVVAGGDEPFDTLADGHPVDDHPDLGEIVWRDDRGVTCRRWNWRQCIRTRLTTSTTDALFIIDSLGDDADARADACAEDLVSRLSVDSRSATFVLRSLPV